MPRPNDELEERKKQKSVAQKRDEERRSKASQERAAAQAKRPAQNQSSLSSLKPPEERAKIAAAQRGYDPRFDDPNYGKQKKQSSSVVDPKDRARPVVAAPRTSTLPAIEMDVAREQYNQVTGQRPQQQARPVNDELTVERPDTSAPPVSSGYRSPTVQTAQPEPYGPPERPADDGWNPAQAWRRPEPRQQYFTPTTAPPAPAPRNQALNSYYTPTDTRPEVNDGLMLERPDTGAPGITGGWTPPSTMTSGQTQQQQGVGVYGPPERPEENRFFLPTQPGPQQPLGQEPKG